MQDLDKIYILTCRRVDDQITYNALPQKLKEKVCFVVQDWEREQYNYDAEYLVLPKDIQIKMNDYYKEDLKNLGYEDY